MTINIGFRPVWCVAVALLLASCMNQTSIQRSYISERNDCQGEAESKIGDYEDDDDTGDLRRRNAKLVSLFSDCMFEYGWTVAAPEREEEAAAAHDNSVGIADTIKPGQSVVSPTQAQAPDQPIVPTAPPGYEYRLVPVAPSAGQK